MHRNVNYFIIVLLHRSQTIHTHTRAHINACNYVYIKTTDFIRNFFLDFLERGNVNYHRNKLVLTISTFQLPKRNKYTTAVIICRKCVLGTDNETCTV